MTWIWYVLDIECCILYPDDVALLFGIDAIMCGHRCRDACAWWELRMKDTLWIECDHKEEFKNNMRCVWVFECVKEMQCAYMFEK